MPGRNIIHGSDSPDNGERETALWFSEEELVQNENDGEVAGDNEMDTGVLDTISQQFESLDYFTNYSSLLLDEIRIRGYKFVVRKVGFFIKYYNL